MFPIAFAVVSVALHVPLLIALVGIVLRGSAFVFRAYGMQPDPVRERWGRVFAWASALTPVVLGMSLAAISSGAIRVGANGVPTTGFFAGWTSPFAVAVGVFALSLFALLAATYLANDADARGESELCDDFRRRALISEAVAGALAAVVLWRAWADSPLLFEGLIHAPWSMPVQALTAASQPPRSPRSRFAGSGSPACSWSCRSAWCWQAGAPRWTGIWCCPTCTSTPPGPSRPCWRRCQRCCSGARRCWCRR